MKKICLVIMTLILSVSTLSYADEWKTYANQKLGYEIHYPANGAVTAVGEAVKNNFYLNPLQPVADLLQTPEFANARVNSKSLVKIAFPNYYLIMLSIDHAPKNIVLPQAQLINIGQYNFYKQYSTDAAMGHDFTYYTYFLRRHDHVYVFLFLLTKNIYTDNGSENAQDPTKVNTQVFEQILSTLKFH